MSGCGDMNWPWMSGWLLLRPNYTSEAHLHRSKPDLSVLKCKKESKALLFCWNWSMQPCSPFCSLTDPPRSARRSKSKSKMLTYPKRWWGIRIWHQNGTFPYLLGGYDGETVHSAVLLDIGGSDRYGNSTIRIFSSKRSKRAQNEPNRFSRSSKITVSYLDLDLYYEKREFITEKRLLCVRRA